jgi:hypothetical protein
MMEDFGIKSDSGTKLKHTSLLYTMRVSPLLVCAKVFYIDATNLKDEEKLPYSEGILKLICSHSEEWVAVVSIPYH